MTTCMYFGDSMTVRVELSPGFGAYKHTMIVMNYLFFTGEMEWENLLNTCTLYTLRTMNILPIT